MDGAFKVVAYAISLACQLVAAGRLPQATGDGFENANG